ncbi:MAG: Calx-beta domain-containing protein, partial [Methylococcaceae bacterium]
DTVVYQGNQDDYKLSFDADSQTWTVEDINGTDGDGIDEGTDLITDVETLSFADGDKTVGTGGEAVTPPPVTPVVTPELSIQGVTLQEGDTGTRDAVLTISLSQASTQTISVTVNTQDDTATAGKDYTPLLAAVVSFAPGVTSQSISVPVLGDVLYEGDERLSVSLTNPRNALLKAGLTPAYVTIQDDDPLPVVSISASNSAVIEGQDGQTSVSVKLSLSQASERQVSVAWETADATANAGSDYIAASETATFAPGVTEQVIQVQVNGDLYMENDEAFSVFLKSANNAVLATINATEITILNDDKPTEFDDRLLLTEGSDDIDMLAGNDSVSGLGGNDTLTGNGGDDTLDGGEGDDLLLGGEGNDVLWASNGKDTLSGGLGDDHYLVVGNPTGQLVIEDTGGKDTLDASAATAPAIINLTPGQTSTVGSLTITLSSGGKVSDPLDTYFLQDVSGSFSDDVDTVLNIVPQVVSSIKKFQPDSLIGLGSFIDKPVLPFGRNTGDYVFKQNLSMTKDQSAFSAALDTLVIGDGNDIPEAQLESLMQVALHSDEIGFRGDAVKVVVLMTDAPFHKAGDGVKGLISTPNNGDGVLDGSPEGTGEDYPTVAQAASALKQAGILPIFAVTKDAMSTYQNLVNDLGMGSVVQLSSDSSNLATVIQSGIKALTVATVENAKGSPLDDTITGDANPNQLDGFDGNDKLDGNSGNDTLLGGNGNDSLFGSAGNDVLDGGLGVDLLNGGEGDDRWIFRPGDSGVGTNNRDIISGFNVPSSAEVIDLSAMGMPLRFIGTANFNAPGQVRTYVDASLSATIVQINLDSNYTTPEMELEVGLVGASTLTASDFILA